jgi:hypothetical protein
MLATKTQRIQHKRSGRTRGVISPFSQLIQLGHIPLYNPHLYDWQLTWGKKTLLVVLTPSQIVDRVAESSFAMSYEDNSPLRNELRMHSHRCVVCVAARCELWINTSYPDSCGVFCGLPFSHLCLVSRCFRGGCQATELKQSTRFSSIAPPFSHLKIW